MMIGSVILIFSHAYFHSLEETLTATAEAQRSRMIIGEKIVSNLLRVKTNFYQLLAGVDAARRQYLQTQISERLGEIRGALQTIEDGVAGSTGSPPTSLADENEKMPPPVFSANDSKSARYLQEILALRPHLFELEKNIVWFEYLTQKRDLLIDNEDADQFLTIQGEVSTFVANIDPLFTKLSEESNSLYQHSSKILGEIEMEEDELSRRYHLVEIMVVFAIFFVTFIFCFLLTRKIFHINSRLKQEIREKEQAELSISRGKQEWERTFDAVPHAIALLDAKHRIIRLNRAMADLVGKTVQECVGEPCFRLMHLADCPPEYCPHSKLITHPGEYRTEQFMPNFGAYFDVSVSPLFDDRGTLFGSVHIARDITERKRMQEQLQLTNEQLEQKVAARTAELQKSVDDLKQEIHNRKLAEEALVHTQHQLLHAEKLSAIGKLSASIAHEFNNPLFAIMNIIIGVQQHETLSPPNERMVGLAVKECERMKNLIHNLQDFNRPTSGVMLPTDIHQVIDDMLLLCKKDLKNRRIKVEKAFGPDMPVIMAVTDQLRQVLLNLLTNARDACANGGFIRISTENTDSTVLIKVKDTGIGIAPENIKSIFKPFFTTKQDFSGNGLGLAVSYGIIEDHGGSMSVQSRPNHGSVFIIELPIQPQEGRSAKFTFQKN